MTRYVDVLRLHDGETGPEGVPALCVEHDGARPLGARETRLTVEEYRAQEPAWRAAQEAWLAAHPPPPAPEMLAPLPRLAFVALVEDGLGLAYGDLPALIDAHVSDADAARRIKRALTHAREFDADAEPIEGVGAIRWLARRLGVSDTQFAALWRAAGG